MSSPKNALRASPPPDRRRLRRHLATLGVVLALALTASSRPATAADSCGSETGIVTRCGEGEAADAGSADRPLRPSAVLGNPIDLITGNKYQRERDFAAVGSSLAFERHYNSANADFDTGLGQGWSHTFATSLFAVNGGASGYDIVQSDGRRLRFRTPDVDTSGRALWRATSASDGYLRPATTASPHGAWHLPDGRVLAFQGSFLVRVDREPHTGSAHRSLRLLYRERRLASVTDELGRTFRLEWTPGRAGLPGFDPADDVDHAGHLARLILPDGGVVRYGYDHRRNLTSARYPDGTVRRYHYEDPRWPNRLTGLTDRTAHRTRNWTYDERGRASSSERADGVERVALAIGEPDAAGYGSTTVTNSLGGTSVYAWRRDAGTGAAVLLSAEGPGCASCPPTGRRYAYTDSGQLASRTDDDGTRHDYAHDERGRPVSLTEHRSDDDVRTVLRLEYDDDAHVPSRAVRVIRPSVFPDGEHVIETLRDANGLPLAVVERGFAPLGTREIDGFEPIERTTRFEHDAAGRLIAIDGPREDVDDVVRFRHEDGILVGIERPGGRSVEILDRDALGRPTSLRFGPFAPVAVAYDPNGHVATVTRGGRTVRYAHDTEGRLLSLTDPDGRTTRFEHDAAERATATRDDIGRRVERVFDTESRLVEQRLVGTDGEAWRVSRYAFDALGYLASSVRENRDASSGVEGSGAIAVHALEHRWDDRSRLVATIDPTSGARVDIEHDPGAHRVHLRGTDASGDAQAVSLHRDAKDRNAGFTDARGNRTHTLRDDFGRVAVVSSPDTGTIRYRRDAAGNPRLRTDADGREVRSTHDAADRLIRRETPDGVTHYAHDPRSGRLTEVANDVTRETFAHDDEGRLLEHVRHLDGQTFVTRHAYDEAGRVLRTTLPGGQTLRYHYREEGPARGSLRAITRESLFGLRQTTLVGEIDRDARDGRSGHVAHNGLRTERRFGADGRPLSIEIAGTLRLDYTFDAAGRITGIEEGSTRQRYAYRHGRLVGADTPAGRFAYAYDAAGNRTADVTVRADGTTRRAYRHAEPGEGNRLTGVATTNGTVTASSDPADAFVRELDADGRPVRVLENGRVLAEYAYNGFGERVRKVVHRGDGRQVTYYLYDGNRLTAEIDGTSGEIRDTLHLDGRPVALLVGERTYAVHTDPLGAPRALSDEEGRPVWRARYAPFGRAEITLARVAFPYRLPGQYHDAETGTHYNYLRDYDPTSGRYLAPDPLGLEGGPNAFVYAGNDPLGRHDVLGLKPVAAFGSDEGYLIGASEYLELKGLFDGGDAVGYYALLYELTDHPLFDELAESYRPPGEESHALDGSSVLTTLERLFAPGSFTQIAYAACSADGEALYKIPDIGLFVETAFQAAGVELAFARFVEDSVEGTVTFLGGLVGWSVDMGALGALGDILRERFGDEEVPAWVPSMEAGGDTVRTGLTIAGAIAEDPSLIWSSLTDPIVRDWAEGRYGATVTTAGLNLASLPLVPARAGNVARVSQILVVAKRADAAGLDEFGQVAGRAVAEARRQGVDIADVVDGARDADVLDELLAGGVLRQDELDDLVERDVLSNDERARAGDASPPEDAQTSSDESGATAAESGKPASQTGTERNLPFTDADRLQEVNATLDHMEAGGPYPYKKDGTVFRNREGKLPPGSYREYTVRTPGAPNRGARRIVQEENTGRTYYTDDHYNSFIEIDR